MTMRSERIIGAAPVVLTASAGITATALLFFLRFDTKFFLGGLDASYSLGMTRELTWAVSYVALVPAVVWLGAMAFLVTSQYLSSARVRLLVAISLILAITAPLLARLVQGPGKALVLALADSGHPLITVFTGVAFGAAVFVTTLLLSACVLLAYVPTENLDSIRKRVRLGRVLLYSAAFALAVGVFQMYALLNWAATTRIVMNHPNTIEPLQNLAAASSLGAGALYTLLLILFFVPVAVAHSESTEAAYAAAISDAPMDREEWLAGSGLSQSPTTAAVDLFAIMGPILTGLGLLHK
jgi:hypothetical protein